MWILAVLLAIGFLVAIKNHDADSSGSIIGNTVNVVKSGTKKVADTAGNAVDGAADLAEGAVDAVEDGAEAVADAAGDAVDAVEDGAKAVADAAGDAVDAGEELIEDTDEVEEAIDGDAEANGEAEAEVVVDTASAEGYIDFNEEDVKFALEDGKKVALFFHADRCPSCVVLDEEITEEKESIDNDTVIFKVNYDEAKDLTDKFNVTKQHTVVYLDENMEATMLKGGISSLEELLNNF